MHTELIKFYTQAGQDAENRTHNEIMNFSNEELEGCHNFIQWLFPTETKSSYNALAPILNLGTIKGLKSSPVFHQRFSQSLKRMFAFWDLGVLYKSSDHLAQKRLLYPIVQPITYKRSWMEYDNHNLLRMSRVMESCRLLGFHETGKSLFEVLIATVKTHPEFYFIENENLFWWYCSASGFKI